MSQALVGSLGPEALGLMASTEPSDANQFGFEAVRVASDCGIPLDTFAPQTGFAYGDNPTLDGLYDECAEGIGASCDALYERSGVSTDYETFGLTCGSRFQPADAPLACEGSI